MSDLSVTYNFGSFVVPAFHVGVMGIVGELIDHAVHHTRTYIHLPHSILDSGLTIPAFAVDWSCPTQLLCDLQEELLLVFRS